jgi:hypothetical protein
MSTTGKPLSEKSKFLKKAAFWIFLFFLWTQFLSGYLFLIGLTGSIGIGTHADVIIFNLFKYIISVVIIVVLTRLTIEISAAEGWARNNEKGFGVFVYFAIACSIYSWLVFAMLYILAPAVLVLAQIVRYLFHLTDSISWICNSIHTNDVLPLSGSGVRFILSFSILILNCIIAFLLVRASPYLTSKK